MGGARRGPLMALAKAGTGTRRWESSATTRCVAPSPPAAPSSCPASRRRITQSAHVSGKCAFFAKCFVNVSVANFIISWHEGGAKESALQQRSKAEKREKALRKLCKLSSVVAAESEASCGMRHTASVTPMRGSTSLAFASDCSRIMLHVACSMLQYVTQLIPCSPASLQLQLQHPKPINALPRRIL